MNTTTEIPGINFAEFKAHAKNVFDNPFYDGIINLLDFYFPRSVTVDIKKNCIYVRDQITMTLNVSFNEQKIYFYSYITADNLENDLIYAEHKKQKSFRLFSETEVLSFLHLKKVENEFIRGNAG